MAVNSAVKRGEFRGKVDKSSPLRDGSLKIDNNHVIGTYCNA